jgi:hypothetical protein
MGEEDKKRVTEAIWEILLDMFGFWVIQFLQEYWSFALGFYKVLHVYLREEDDGIAIIQNVQWVWMS